MAGNDIRSMSPATREILTNKELIAVNQDSLGVQGRRVRRDGDLEVWSKQLGDGGRAVALLNRSEVPSQITVSWTDIGYPQSLNVGVRDLWEKKDLGAMKGNYSATVPSHGAVVVRLMPAAGSTPTS
jgi:alpha-galactosidase